MTLPRDVRGHVVSWLGDARNIWRHGWGAPRIGQRLYADPACIATATRRWIFHRSDCGNVVDGDWDQDLVAVEELQKVSVVYRHVRDGLSWDDAGAYRLMLRLIDRSRDRAYDGCRTLADVVRRYERLDALVVHLKAGGRFLEGPQLGQVREHGGVLVHVGRDGEFIFGRSGCHRLAIARSLGLPALPVLLGVVHARALAAGTFKDVQERSRRLRRAVQA